MSETADRVRELRDRLKREGLVRLEVWVPEDEVEEFRHRARVFVRRHRGRLAKTELEKERDREFEKSRGPRDKAMPNPNAQTPTQVKTPCEIYRYTTQ